MKTKKLKKEMNKTIKLLNKKIRESSNMSIRVALINDLESLVKARAKL